MVNGSVGIRHLVLDHQFPFRDNAKAQDCGLYHPVALDPYRSYAGHSYYFPRFMEEVDKEISEMKLSLNARARVVAESYLTAVRALWPSILPLLLLTYAIVQFAS